MTALNQLQSRWYYDLLSPVHSPLSKSLIHLEHLGDLWSTPRVGLGGAILLHVARTFGGRKWRKASRASVIALEAYNLLVYRDFPDQKERLSFFENNMGWMRQIWDSVSESEGQLIDRVLKRLVQSSSNLGDICIPETVIFLRAAVATGVLIGDVPDRVHAHLDLWATWLGILIESELTSLTEESWLGATQAVNLVRVFPSDPKQSARSEGYESLKALPNSQTKKLLESLLNQVSNYQSTPRSLEMWVPYNLPILGESKTVYKPSFSPPLAEFSRDWQSLIDDSLRALVATDSSVLNRATSYLHSQGGKRLRPLLTLLAARACGGAPERGLRVAAAVEWLHQGSVVLDDIIDEAHLRRGYEALHQATTPHFAIGISAFLFVRIHIAIEGMHPAIRKRLINAASAIAYGEHLELQHTFKPALRMQDYYQVIEAKTARLFACAASLGALSVGASKSQVKSLTRFGREAGIAFQIIDDLLDYTKSTDQLGKTRGTDLREGKMTLPLLLLRERLPLEDQRRLALALGDITSLEWILQLMQEHHIPQRCIEHAEGHLEKAIRAISSLPDQPGREMLAELATRFVKRDL